MPILEINGRRVEVDDGFLSMTLAQQNATVDEIARSIGAAPAPGTDQRPAQGPWTKYQRQREPESFDKQAFNSAAPRSQTIEDFQRGTGAFAADPAMPAVQSSAAPRSADTWRKQQAAPRVIEFEGRRIEVPSDATDDEIRAILSEPAAGPWEKYQQRPVQGPQEQPTVGPWQKYQRLQEQPAFAAPAPEPAVNQGVDVPTYLGQSSARAVADAIGAPVDLVAAGLNLGLIGADTIAELLGGNVDTRIEKPLMGSQWIKDTVGDLYEAAGGSIVPPEAVSPGVRIAGDAVQAAGAASIGGLGLASGTAQTAAKSATRAGRWLAPLAQPYRNSVRPVIGDTVAGAGAGAAAGSYDEAMPESVKDVLGPLGPSLAALAGGVAGAGTQAVVQGTADRLANVGRNIVSGRADPASPFFEDIGRRFTRQEMDDAARAVQAQASDPAKAAGRIRAAAHDLADVASPGSMPTAGALSDDIGLALLEKEARVRNPAKFGERDRAVVTRAGDIARSVAPDGSASRDFTDAADRMFADRLAGARGDLQAVQTAQAAAGKQARLRAEPVTSAAGQGVPASQRLDAEIVGQSLRPMQERKNAAFAAIDPDRSVVRDAQPLIQAAEEIRGSLGRLNDPTSVLPTRTLDRIAALSPEAGGPGTITYGELNALRPELGAALVKARAAGDFALADNIQALQRAINREGTRLAAEATPAGRRAAEAQRIYSEEFAPVWNTGPGDEATRFRRDVNADREGRTLSPPSATASRFLRAGEPEKAASLRRILDSLPDRKAAEAEARRYLAADMAESGIVDSTERQLRPDALRRWRNKWGASLDVVPGFRDEVDGLLRSSEADAFRASRLAADVRAAEGRLDDVTRNRGALGLVLGKDPVNAVASIFGDGDPERAMRELVETIGTNKRASDGLKASVVDYLLDNTTGPGLPRTADKSRPLDFAKLENLFSRHERTLAAVFSPEEMNALRSAHRLLAPSEALKRPGAGVRYEGAKSEQAWRLLEGGLKARFGVLKGGGVLRTIRIFAASLPRSDDAVNDILVRLHFDPEFAAHLLGRQVDPVSPQWNAKLNKLLAAATGARASVEGEGAGDGKPLELTIGRPNASSRQ